jgi:cell shape-determining protein MreC
VWESIQLFFKKAWENILLPAIVFLVIAIILGAVSFAFGYNSGKQSGTGNYKSKDIDQIIRQYDNSRAEAARAYSELVESNRQLKDRIRIAEIREAERVNREAERNRSIDNFIGQLGDDAQKLSSQEYSFGAVLLTIRENLQGTVQFLESLRNP